MSGFEIIGVVLGALPLFISAAENYQKSYDAFHRFFHRDRILKKYAAELREQHALLTLYLQALIGSTNLSTRDQRTLVNDPSHPLWQTPAVEREIERRLGMARASFLGSLETLSQALVTQVKKDFFVQSEDENAVRPLYLSRTALASTEQVNEQFKKLADLKVRDKAASRAGELLWDKLRISSKDPEKNKDLRVVKECNATLERLIKAVEGTTAFRRKQDLGRAHGEYSVRLQAQTLFDALSRECECSLPHQPKLHTKPFLSCSDHTCHMWFDVLLLLSESACCEMSIGILKESSQPSTISEIRLRVEAQQSQRPGPQSIQDQNNWHLIGQICEAINKTRDRNLQLDLAVDTDQQLWEVNSRLHPPQRIGTRELLNLEECLETLTEHWRKRWFHREKAILANILAHSLLQLHGSSWLTRHWSMKDIIFIKGQSALDPATFSKSGFELRKVYFSSATSTISSTNELAPGHRNPSLLSFGIILLELYLNRSISDEISAHTAYEIRSVVSDMLDECYENDDMTEEYRSAIRFCLWPDPDEDSRSYSFEDPGFREKYYHEVVMPLETYLKTKVADFNDDFWNSL